MWEFSDKGCNVKCLNLIKKLRDSGSVTRRTGSDQFAVRVHSDASL